MQNNSNKLSTTNVGLTATTLLGVKLIGNLTYSAKDYNIKLLKPIELDCEGSHLQLAIPAVYATTEKPRKDVHYVNLLNITEKILISSYEDKLKDIANNLCNAAIYLLDYDLMGLEFNVENQADRLFNCLMSTDNNIIKSLPEDEFNAVVKILIKKLNESTEQAEEDVVNEIIKWILNNFTYQAISLHEIIKKDI